MSEKDGIWIDLGDGSEDSKNIYSVLGKVGAGCGLAKEKPKAMSLGCEIGLGRWGGLVVLDWDEGSFGAVVHAVVMGRGSGDLFQCGFSAVGGGEVSI